MLFALVVAFWFLPPAQPLNENFLVGVAAMWDKVLALLLILPTVKLMGRIQVPSALNSGEASKGSRGLNKIFLLSVLAAALILINAWMIAVNGDVIKFQYDIYKIKFGFKDVVRPLAPYGFIWLLIGLTTLIGAILLYTKPEKRIIGGSLVLISSCLSAVIGGGFIIGLILGVLGGFLSVIKERLPLPKTTNLEVLLYFLLAFIGNEADNAWGNDVFALPPVYKGIFQIPTIEIVRGLFLVSPFAYFIIRLLQAMIASLIAVPLLRNLKAAGLAVVKP